MVADTLSLDQQPRSPPWNYCTSRRRSVILSRQSSLVPAPRLRLPCRLFPSVLVKLRRPNAERRPPVLTDVVHHPASHGLLVKFVRHALLRRFCVCPERYYGWCCRAPPLVCRCRLDAHLCHCSPSSAPVVLEFRCE